MKHLSKQYRLPILLCLLALGACSAEEAERAAAPMSKADVIFTNGHILTLDEADTVATRLVVGGERILAVGDAELAARFEAPVVVDLEGRTLMPGFVDSHTHIYGRPPHFIDLNEVSSVAVRRSRIASSPCRPTPTPKPASAVRLHNCPSG